MNYSHEPRAVLVRLYQERGVALLDSPDQLSGLLLDLCGKHKPEMHSLVNTVRAGLINPANNTTIDSKDVLVAQLVDKIRHALGLDEGLARWTADSWALAMGWISKEDVQKSVSCPCCSFPAAAERTWQGQVAICPKCKSEVSFDRTLQPQLKVKGSPKKNEEEIGNWILIDTQARGTTLKAQQLKNAITNILQDTKLSDQVKADRLGLRHTIGKLEQQANEILIDIHGDSSNALGSLQEVLTSILRGFQPLPGMSIGNEPSVTMTNSLRKSCEVPEKEEILAILEFASFDDGQSGVVFGSEAIHFCNQQDAIHPGPSQFRYQEMRKHEWVASSLQEVGMGDSGKSLHLGGSGISKATMINILGVIQHVVSRNFDD